MSIRRRLLMNSRIGYTSGVAWVIASAPPAIEENESFFITGFIPYVPAEYGDGRCALTFRYSSGDYYNKNRHAVVFYGADKEPLWSGAYFDMTVSSGVRSVSYTNALLVNDTRYIRISGYLPSINNCYVYDDNSKIYLWKKGM